jgi:vancomycin resistance protein YoaR
VSEDRRPRRDSDLRVIPWLLLGLVVLFGSLYVAAYLFTSGRIPRGTTVGGVRVGGLVPAAAEQRLREGLGGRAAEPVTVVANGRRTSVVPARMGLAVDVPRTVAAVGGARSWDPRRMWDYVVGGHAQAPVVRVDQGALRAFVDSVAAGADRPASDGRVVFDDGAATPRFPQDGTVVDRPRAATALRAAFLLTHGPVELPTRVDHPRITRAAVSRAMDSFANPAVSAPVVLRLDGEGVSVAPEEFTDALSMAPRGSDLVPRLDEPLFEKVVGARLHQLTAPPREATVKLVDGRPRVVPARAGVGFAPSRLSAGFLDVLRATGGARVLEVPPVVDRPRVTTAQARGWRITRRVSSSTTSFAFAPRAGEDLTRAARHVDGVVVPPGDKLPLMDLLGTEPSDGSSGQVAAVAYDAAMSAGLEVENLVLRNTSSYGVLVHAWVSPAAPHHDGTVHVTLWSGGPASG